MSKHEPEPTHLKLGIALALIGYVFFVTASSLVWSFKNRFSTIQIIFIQNAVSLLCILPVALRHGTKHLKTEVLPIHLMRDVFGVLSYYLFFLAIRFLNLVDATILNYTAPFFVPVIWWVWMREKVGRHVWWSIIIGFIGVAVILNPTRQMFQLGFVLGLFAGILSAVAFVALRILNVHKEPMTRTLFYYFLTGTILSFPFAWIYWIHPSGHEWWGAIGIGAATAGGQMLLTVAYRYGTASYLSPLGYSSVVYAGLVSWALFDRVPSWRSAIGTLLIIIGGTLTYVLKKKPTSIAETFEVPAPRDKPPF